MSRTATILFGRLTAMAISLALVGGARAASYYWDTNGASAGIGSAGGSAANWLSNSWATGSTGTLTTGAWPNTQPNNPDRAVFQGTAGTVNISADVNANALSFSTRDYIIASTGGALRLSGSEPTIDVNLPSTSAQTVVTITAPIFGDGGLKLVGNGLAGGLRFLVLANTSAVTPNAFTGTLSIDATGALRLGGGAANEQIPDNVDMSVAGVIDFITSGGASDGKQEKVHNVTVTGASANFSIGNESDFIVNSMTGTNTSGAAIAINGNNGSATGTHDPGTLRITGWSDGHGDLTLHDGLVRLNTTSATSAVGSRVILSGDIESSGDSSVTNVNGGGGNVEANAFTNRAFDFASAAHTVEVADGTLTFTSRSVSHPLEITTTQPGGAVITKTGGGTWRLENFVETTFSGAMKVDQGTLSVGNAGLAAALDLYVKDGSTLNLDFSGSNTVDSLFVNGVAQAVGTWGRVGHPMAQFTSPLISGDGLLNVTHFAPALLLGDFNGDMVVDAADYTVWRDNLGSSANLPNDQTPGTVSNDDFDDWKTHFGMTGGGGSAGLQSATVPEASGSVLVLFALTKCLSTRRRHPLEQRFVK